MTEPGLKASPPDEERVAEIRHDCHRLLIVVKRRGIQLKCDKCNREVLYTWRHVLAMMLSAEMAEMHSS